MAHRTLLFTGAPVENGRERDLKEDLMSAVIDMKSWKASRKPKPAPASPSTGERLYFCTACDSERFRIFESGAVRCGHCDAELRRAPSIFALSLLPFFLAFGRW